MIKVLLLLVIAIAAASSGYYSGTTASLHVSMDYNRSASETESSHDAKHARVREAEPATIPAPIDLALLGSLNGTAELDQRPLILALKEACGRDELGTWRWVLAAQRDVPDADWRRLCDALRRASRLHVDKEYEVTVAAWEDAKGANLISNLARAKTDNDAKWQSTLDASNNKPRLLTIIAANNLIQHDWVATCDFLQAQATGELLKGQILDVACARWAASEGCMAPAAWISEQASEGGPIDIARAGLAIDCCKSDPQLALKLISGIKSQERRDLTVCAIVTLLPPSSDAQAFASIATEETRTYFPR